MRVGISRAAGSLQKKKPFARASEMSYDVVDESNPE